ncbi:hypothetical protein RKLH11_810 [Rhodobacteraceae bacterium KLH11]|nr:hypothetical protein RKLH11_810 [Rhodobacteraceae bacterium KLH11]
MKDTTDPPATKRPSIRLNLDDWLPYLEDSDASEAEKIELIETLWNIAMAFVDLGWDLDSGEETSGQSLDLTAVLRAAVLNSKDNDKEEV